MSRLKNARLKAGLTQVALAERSGVPQSTISELESGRTADPGYLTLVKLARALGRRTESLFPVPVAVGDVAEAEPEQQS